MTFLWPRPLWIGDLGAGDDGTSSGEDRDSGATSGDPTLAAAAAAAAAVRLEAAAAAAAMAAAESVTLRGASMPMPLASSRSLFIGSGGDGSDGRSIASATVALAAVGGSSRGPSRLVALFLALPPPLAFFSAM